MNTTKKYSSVIDRFVRKRKKSAYSVDFFVKEVRGYEELYQAMLIMGGLVFLKDIEWRFLYSFREGAKRVLHTKPGGSY
jgi:hypothetical protein